MAHVEIHGGLQHYTGGTTSLEVVASSLRALLRQLDELYPGIAAELKSTTRVAIDGELVGEIVSDAILEPIGPDSEVIFIQAIAGG